MSFFSRIYIKFFVNEGFSYAEYYKKRGILLSQGENCYISKGANISDPYLTSIGNNVWITLGCNLLCHDASVIIINMMRNSHLDRVEPIVIGDNCFLGNNVTVLPGIKIGSNTILGTGSIVTRDIPDNSVYAGNPSRFITSFSDYENKIKSRTKQYPWCELLQKNKTHVFDQELEASLRRERINYFFKR